MISKHLFNRLRSVEVHLRRGYADRNILSLSERGFFQDIFPDNAR